MRGKNEKPPNVLIVEHCYDDMMLCKQLIVGMEPETIIVESGNFRTALKILSTQHFDAVFISINLPESGGFNIANAMRAMEGYALVPIVFMGRQEDIHPDLLRRYHCYDYVCKPLTKDGFYRKVELLFRGLREACVSQTNHRNLMDRVLTVDTLEKKYLIHLRDIHFAEISARKLTLYTKHGVIKGIRMKLKNFVQYVDDPRFVRCHKSFAVNIENIYSLKYVEPRVQSIQFIGETTQECLLSKTFFNTVLDRIVNEGDKTNQMAVGGNTGTHDGI